MPPPPSAMCFDLPPPSPAMCPDLPPPPVAMCLDLLPSPPGDYHLIPLVGAPSTSSHFFGSHVALFFLPFALCFENVGKRTSGS